MFLGGKDAAVEERSRSTLTLFVAWVFADNTHDSLAANDAAGFTESLNRRTDLHQNGLVVEPCGRDRLRNE